MFRVDFQKAIFNRELGSSGVDSVKSTARSDRLAVLRKTSGLWISELIVGLNGRESSQNENSKTRLIHNEREREYKEYNAVPSHV
jgi:hypothetical protein